MKSEIQTLSSSKIPGVEEMVPLAASGGARNNLLQLLNSCCMNSRGCWSKKKTLIKTPEFGRGTAGKTFSARVGVVAVPYEASLQYSNNTD